MAEAGAKVICAQAVEWARKKGIAIHARSTFDDRRETVIRPVSAADRPAARAVVNEPKVILVR
jgi:aspartate kinase